MLTEAFRGGVLTLVGRGVQVAAHFVGLWLLAPHLTEGEFGLAVMVAVASRLLGSGSDLGMGVVALQRESCDDRRAFRLSMGGGAGAAALLALGAPLVARAFDAPASLKPLLRAAAPALLLAGLASTARARLGRNLSFGTLAFVDASVAIFAAYRRVRFAQQGYGAWSIVLGDLYAAALGAAALWLLAPRSKAGPAGDLAADGVRVVGTRTADACFAQADRFAVGRGLGEGALGLYGFAMQHAMALLSQLGPVVEQVALPLFARLQQDRAMLARSYLSLTRLFALIVVPAAALLWVLADPLVAWLYPPRWGEAVPMLRALCVAAACAGLNSHPGLVWLALGRMRLRLHWSLWNLLALAVILLVGIRHGATGVAYALAARSLLATAVAQGITRRVAGVEHAAYLRALWPGAAVGAAIVALDLLRA